MKICKTRNVQIFENFNNLNKLAKGIANKKKFKSRPKNIVISKPNASIAQPNRSSNNRRLPGNSVAINEPGIQSGLKLCCAYRRYCSSLLKETKERKLAQSIPNIRIIGGIALTILNNPSHQFLVLVSMKEVFVLIKK